jgi:hypothetical protein
MPIDAIGMIEDRGPQRGAKQRIAGQDAFGLAANGPPKLIDWCYCVLGHDLRGRRSEI